MREMLVAFLIADLETREEPFRESRRFPAAALFLFLLTFGLIFVFGPGAVSIDHLIANKFAPDASAVGAHPQSA